MIGLMNIATNMVLLVSNPAVDSVPDAAPVIPADRTVIVENHASEMDLEGVDVDRKTLKRNRRTV